MVGPPDVVPISDVEGEGDVKIGIHADSRRLRFDRKKVVAIHSFNKRRIRGDD
jgi:hypothetical protein